MMILFWIESLVLSVVMWCSLWFFWSFTTNSFLYFFIYVCFVLRFIVYLGK